MKFVPGSFEKVQGCSRLWVGYSFIRQQENSQLYVGLWPACIESIENTPGTLVPLPHIKDPNIHFPDLKKSYMTWIWSFNQLSGQGFVQYIHTFSVLPEKLQNKSTLPDGSLKELANVIYEGLEDYEDVFVFYLGTQVAPLLVVPWRIVLNSIYPSAGTAVLHLMKKMDSIS